MKKRVKQLFKHPLIYGSTIVVVGNLVVNFFNFLFNIFMTRNLTNAEYGVLASIISVISFPALVSAAMIPLVIKFAGSYFAKGELNKARGFYFKIFKFFFAIGAILFVIFVGFIPAMSNFLHIEDTTLLVITSVIVFIGAVNSINIAFLQAKLAFVSLVLVNLSGTVTKLIFGVLAVILGFQVSGVIGAILASAVIAYAISFIPLKVIFAQKKNVPDVNTKELLRYGIPSMVTWIGLTSLISVDIILVKHYFDPTSAGIYAAMALIGKVIFYVSSPIGSVMFPLIVQKHSMNENFSNTFKLSLFLVFAPSVIMTLIYFFFPDPTIFFFTKKTENLVVSPLLGFFGVYMSLYTILYIIVTLYLSLGKTKVFLPVICGAVLQVVLIVFNHESFMQIILLSIGITGALVLWLVGYYYFKIRGHKFIFT